MNQRIEEQRAVEKAIIANDPRLKSNWSTAEAESEAEAEAEADAEAHAEAEAKAKTNAMAKIITACVKKIGVQGAKPTEEDGVDLQTRLVTN